jgi:holo-[acyl-carrier protein] synthase
MRIVGHGIDITEVARVETLLADPNADFLEGWFTETEQALCSAPHLRAQYYAGRVTVKEAVAKALGTGFSRGVTPTDIEVGRLDTGQPTAILTGAAAAIATSLGVTQWFVSLGHGPTYAVGSAIGVAG